MWTCDESGTGAMQDIISGDTLNVSNVGRVAPGDAAPGGPAIGPSARRFNGTNSFCWGTTAGAHTDIAVNPLTILWSARVRSTANGRLPLISYGGSNTSTPVAFEVGVDDDLHVYVRWQDSGLALVTTTFTKLALTREKFHRCAVEWDYGGNTLALYVDGGLVEEKTPSALPYDTTISAKWQAGSSDLSGADEWFHGDVDHISVIGNLVGAAWIEDAFRHMALLDVETAVHWRVDAKLADGTWQDMRSYCGVDWLQDVTITGDIDEAMESATITLARRVGEMSLGLLHDNQANRSPAVDGTSVFGPADQTHGQVGEEVLTEVASPMTEWRVYVARLPLGIQPTSTDWQLRLQGYNSRPKWGGDGNTIAIEVMDPAYIPHIAWIDEPNLRFGDNASPPLVETVAQDILDWAYNRTFGSVRLLDPAVTLRVLGAPTWTVKEYTQAPMPVLQAVREHFQRMGWDVRTMWNYATEAPALTAYEPDRLRVHPDAVLTQREWRRFADVEFDMASVRTVVTVVYYPDNETQSTAVPTIPTGNTTAAVGTRDMPDAGGQATTDANGTSQPARAFAFITVTTEDLDVSEVGHWALKNFKTPRIMQVTEAASDGIRDIGQAQAMAVALLRDLCLPKAQWSSEGALLPEMEVNDFLRIRADNIQSTSDQDVAVMHFEHGPGGTTMQMRGMPAGGTVNHLEKGAAPGVAPPPLLDPAGNGWTLPPRMAKGVLGLLESTGLARAGRHALLRNPAFANRNFGLNRPPDGWFMQVGTWGTDARVTTTAADVFTGRNALELVDSGNTLRLVTELIPVTDGRVLDVLFAAKKASSGAGNLAIEIDWLDDAAAPALISTTAAFSKDLGTTYESAHAYGKAPAGARWARVALERSNANDVSVFVGMLDVTVRHVEATVYLGSDVDTSSGWSAKAWNTVPMDQATYNEDEAFDTASTFQFTAKRSGPHIVSARATVDYNGAGQITQLAVLVDGTSRIKGPANAQADNDGDVVVEFNTAALNLDAGQTAELQIILDSLPTGWAVKAGNTSTYFTVREAASD